MKADWKLIYKNWFQFYVLFGGVQAALPAFIKKIEQLLQNFDVHKASFKHIQNLNDNLIVLESKHKNVEGKYKVKKTSEKYEYQAQYAQTKCFRLRSLLSYSKLESLSL